MAMRHAVAVDTVHVKVQHSMAMPYTPSLGCRGLQQLAHTRGVRAGR